ncbi:MAG: hypothetical protein RAO92_02505 [Candidatus Euphemobacter frigidus]|nr:hypothetical protein [Candidatus Euphemobacter frigidus]MDP8275255.1 hypothetical protein [Candidatus Euphemobacter frigidus]
MIMKTVIFYISGHGFGHASRMAEVINALIRDHPDLKIFIKTSAPEWFFQEQIPGRFLFSRLECDTGVIQSDSLNLDPRRSLESYAGFLAGREKRATAEVRFLRGEGPGLIVGDIPPLAFAAADDAGIPSLGVANFSWDWIYEPYLDRYPEYRYLLTSIRSDYRKAGLLLRLPFAGEMTEFAEIRDVPLIARRSRRSKHEIKEMLSLPDDRPLIILSFGGFSLGEEYYRRLTGIKDLIWLASERVGFDLEGSRNIRREELHRLGLGYPDLVKAADVVVTKPGYGILSECIANRTRMLYTSRGEFREYPILVEGIKRYLPSAFISQDKLRSGDIKEELFQLLEMPENYPPISLDGAQTCAEIIAGYLY